MVAEDADLRSGAAAEAAAVPRTATATATATATGQPKEEWTRVTGKRRQRPRKPSKQPPQHRGLVPPAAVSDGGGGGSTATVDDVRTEHARYRNEWLGSRAEAQLKAIVGARVKDGPSISKAVCFGIGSFDPPDGSWQVKRRAHVQLLAFLTMVEALEDALEDTEAHPPESESASSTSASEVNPPSPIRRRRRRIQRIFQEPLFAPCDVQFLEEQEEAEEEQDASGQKVTAVGGKVVSSPAGFEAVDAHTLVFGVHLYRDIYAQTLAQGCPAAFVGTGYDVWEE
jgi:hypothetical protein